MSPHSPFIIQHSTLPGRHPRPRRRGYVLVVTLALLILASTLLVAVGRAAIRHASAARSAEQDLQRRWGLASCRRAVLPYTEEILLANEPARRKNLARLDVSLRLGNQTFELIVSDEQAKANINAILDEAELTRTESRLRQSLAGSGLINNVRLRPTAGPVFILSNEQPTGASVGSTSPSGIPPTPPTAPSAPAAPTTQPILSTNPSAPRISGLGQIFDGIPPVKLIRPMSGTRLAPIDLVTCWGTGAVNIRRTSEAALGLAAGRALTTVEINRLLDARDALQQQRTGGLSNSGAGRMTSDQLKQLVHDATAQAAKSRANLALVEYSQCHSLWIITRTGQRDWYDLSVIDSANAKEPQTFTYSW